MAAVFCCVRVGVMCCVRWWWVCVLGWVWVGGEIWFKWWGLGWWWVLGGVEDDGVGGGCGWGWVFFCGGGAVGISGGSGGSVHVLGLRMLMNGEEDDGRTMKDDC